MRCLLAIILLVCIVASFNAEPPWQPLIVQYEPGTEVAALAQLQQRGYRLLRRVPAINTLYVRLPPATESQVRKTVAAALEEQHVASAAATSRPDLPTGAEEAGDAVSAAAAEAPRQAAERDSATAVGSSDLEQVAAIVTEAAAPYVDAAAQELENLPVVISVTADPVVYLLYDDPPASASPNIVDHIPGDTAVAAALPPPAAAESVTNAGPSVSADAVSTLSSAVPMFPSSDIVAPAIISINSSTEPPQLSSSSSSSTPFTCPLQQWEDLLNPERTEFTPWGLIAVQALDPTVLSISAAMQETGDITVCVIDTGIDISSSAADLPAGISGCDDQSSPLCYFSWNTSYGQSHGTHVMGTVAAVRGNGKGVVGVAGDSPRVRHVNVFGNSGNTFNYQIISAMDWCIQV